MRFKQGDIIRNGWKTDNDPFRCFIYLNKSGYLCNVINFGKEMRISQFRYTDLENDTHFTKVGHTNAFEMMKWDLTAYNFT